MIQCTENGRYKIVQLNLDYSIGVNMTAFGRKLTLFSAVPLSRFSLKMSRFFLRISSWKNALYMRSTQRQVELR